MIMGILAALLVLWLILILVGLVVKAIFWLAIIGLALFIATGVVMATYAFLESSDREPRIK